MNFKKLLQKNFITYYLYKKLKIFRNSSKNEHLGEFGEDIFIRRFFKKRKKEFMLILGVIIQSKAH